MNEFEDKSKTLYEIALKKNEIENYLKKLEKVIFEMETKYLESTQNSGNILKGWDQLFTNKSKISSSSSLINSNKRVRFSNNERVFSQSSFNNICLRDEQTGSTQSIDILKQ